MLTNIDVRNIRCLDGLHYSFELLSYHYHPLHELCCELNSDSSKIIPVLASCWGFIDALHRIREIAQSLPRLSTKHQEMRFFLDATAITEDYRHYIQHLRNELAKDPPNTFPVWGSLSWVDKNKPSRSYTALFGAKIEGVSYTGSVYDMARKKWVSTVCLGVGGISFNFDPIYEAAMRFKNFVILHLKQSFSNELAFHDKLPIITMDMATGQVQ